MENVFEGVELNASISNTYYESKQNVLPGIQNDYVLFQFKSVTM